MTTKDLDAFFEAGWNGHDVDLLMTFMSDDCVFESIAGHEACGTRYAGPERVRKAFSRGSRRFRRPLRARRHFVRATGGFGVGLHGHQRRRPEGRGERLRRVHVPRRQDRPEEPVLQEPDGIVTIRVTAARFAVALRVSNVRRHGHRNHIAARPELRPSESSESAQSRKFPAGHTRFVRTDPKGVASDLVMSLAGESACRSSSLLTQRASWATV